MPKMRDKATTFEQHLGDVIDEARSSARVTQADLADRIGLPLTNLGRSIRGTRQLTVSEFERIAGVLDTPAYRILDEALARYGGMDKLIAEHAPTSEGPTSIADHRAAKKPSERTEEEMEGLSSAANTDPEIGRDEPDSP